MRGRAAALVMQMREGAHGLRSGFQRGTAEPEWNGSPAAAVRDDAGETGEVVMARMDRGPQLMNSAKGPVKESNLGLVLFC